MQSACKGPLRRAGRAAARGVLRVALLGASLAGMTPALALDILLSNDDGFEASTTHALMRRLRDKGHRVVVAAPVQDQTGKAGAVEFLRPIGVLSADSRSGSVKAGAPGVGTMPGQAGVHYVDSTPAGAVLYGIDVVSRKAFGKDADLVVAGPNYGTSTGAVTMHSGTLGVAFAALNRGLPAVAVSVEQSSSYRSYKDLQENDVEYEIADVVVRLVEALAASREQDGALLPPGIGLNVNLPKFAPGTAKRLPTRLSRVGTESVYLPVFAEDLSRDAIAREFAKVTAPLPGVTLQFGRALPGIPLRQEAEPEPEQLVVNDGAVAVSVIQGIPQAPAEHESTLRTRLKDLLPATDRQREGASAKR